ncbi:MAG: cell division protein ZapA [Nitrospinae bacterium]|nr:cell division protein ZapA [Nitrospinota bacterium]
MASQQVTIYGKTYKIKTDSSSVDAQELAALVDSKMNELSGAKGNTSTIDLAILSALNLGQELMEIKQGQKGRKDDLDQRLDGMIRKLTNSLETIKTKGPSGS